MSKWKLGDRVEVSAILEKHEFQTQPHPYRMWAPMASKPIHGVIVGKRVLANNYVHNDTDSLPYAKETQKVTAYLVAYDMRKNPLYVLPQHLVRVP